MNELKIRQEREEVEADMENGERGGRVRVGRERKKERKKESAGVRAGRDRPGECKPEDALNNNAHLMSWQ